MNTRLLVVGWDGADWQIIDDLLSRGLLPNVASLLAGGARGTLASTTPAHSWAAWPSFLTGLHPAGHGIYDFVGRDPSDPQRRVPITSASIGATTFLEQLSAAGRRVRAANIPVTFPPIPVQGRLISGPIVPPGGRYVHPPEWARELERRAPFPVNGMEWQRFRSAPDRLVEEAGALVERRGESYRVLLEGEWDVAVCVFLAPDRLQHPLGRFLLPSHPAFGELESTPLAASLRGVYASLDRELGRLIECSGPDTTVVLLSDHGFRAVDRVVDMTALLEHLGYAERAAGGELRRALRGSRIKRALARTRAGHAVRRAVRRPAAVRWSRSAAYATASGLGVRLNVRGRESRGIVEESAFESLRAEIRDALLAFRDPETGAPAVDTVLLREDLPSGPHRPSSPDLIAIPAELYSFEHTGALVARSDWPSGAHRTEGIIAACGPGISGDLGTRSITDLAATALAFAGIEPPPTDGTVIGEIAGVRPLSEFVGAGPVHREDTSSPDDEDFMAQHLRDLGYIE